MHDCPFCLQNDLLDGGIIRRDDSCYMVEFHGQVLRDAVMIIPRRHIETPFELTDAEWSSTHFLMKEAKKFLDRQRPGGYSIG